MTGRHSQPDDSYGRRPGPASRGYGDLPAAGRRPGPASTPGPGPRPGEQAPYPGQPAPMHPHEYHPEYNEAPPQWEPEEENTDVVRKLGYVPRESRDEDGPEYFDTETVTAADRTKFRTRKRAKRSSPLVKVLAVVVVVLLLGGIGFGVWSLINASGDDAGSGLTYAQLSKPCDMLDTAPMDPAIEGAEVTTNKNETDKHAHSSEQFCEVGFGKPGEGGNITVNTQVFKRDAGAENAYDDAIEEAKANAKEASDTGGGEQVVGTVTGAGTKAYSVTRKAAPGSKTVDYSLAYYQDNAYIETRVSVYNGGASQKQAAAYTKELAQKYMENWAAA